LGSEDPLDETLLDTMSESSFGKPIWQGFAGLGWIQKGRVREPRSPLLSTSLLLREEEDEKVFLGDPIYYEAWPWKALPGVYV